MEGQSKDNQKVKLKMFPSAPEARLCCRKTNFIFPFRVSDVCFSAGEASGRFEDKYWNKLTWFPDICRFWQTFLLLFKSTRIHRVDIQTLCVNVERVCVRVCCCVNFINVNLNLTSLLWISLSLSVSLHSKSVSLSRFGLVPFSLRHSEIKQWYLWKAALCFTVFTSRQAGKTHNNNNNNTAAQAPFTSHTSIYIQ